MTRGRTVPYVFLFVFYVAFWVNLWVWLSISVVSPWLTSLGLVAWASAIVALVGIGVAVFWVAIILLIVGTSLLAS